VPATRVSRRCPMLPPVLAAGAIIACSAAMLKAVELARRLAPLPRPILLVGQSGVGKGLLARFIHVQSARAGDFVAVADQPQVAPWPERNKLELESKEDWTRIGRSCDRADSFSVCLAMGDVELLRFQRELNAYYLDTRAFLDAVRRATSHRRRLVR